MTRSAGADGDPQATHHAGTIRRRRCCDGVAGADRRQRYRDRRRRRRRARHDARHQRRDRAARRGHRHARRPPASATSWIWASSGATTCSTCASTIRRRWSRAACASRSTSACATTAASRRRSTRRPCVAAATPIPRAGRRGGGGLLSARLRQSRARAARAAEILHAAAPGLFVSTLGRRLPEHARVRALDDDHGQRLHRSRCSIATSKRLEDGLAGRRLHAAGSTSWHRAAAR